MYMTVLSMLFAYSIAGIWKEKIKSKLAENKVLFYNIQSILKQFNQCQITFHFSICLFFQVYSLQIPKRFYFVSIYESPEMFRYCLGGIARHITYMKWIQIIDLIYKMIETNW